MKRVLLCLAVCLWASPATSQTACTQSDLMGQFAMFGTVSSVAGANGATLFCDLNIDSAGRIGNLSACDIFIAGEGVVSGFVAPNTFLEVSSACSVNSTALELPVLGTVGFFAVLDPINGRFDGILASSLNNAAVFAVDITRTPTAAAELRDKMK